MADVLKPSATLLIKLGSLIVHFEEYNSPHGHPLDWQAIKGLLDDEEVKEWLKGMDKLTFLPKKRN